MRAEGALAALLAAVAITTAAPAAAADRVRARLDLTVNGAPKGEVLVVLDQGDALVAVADLEAAGLVRLAGERSRIGEREHVSLRSLAPRLSFAVEERALRLDLKAEAELLRRERLDFAPERPRGVVEGREASAFLNYSVQAASDLRPSASNVRPSASAELGAGEGGGLLVSGLSATQGGGVVRGLSTASLEEPEVLRRWVAGDAAVSLGGLGSGAVVGGLGVARDFTLDPYLVQAARPATSAFAASPSTLEVYVNGALVRRQEVAPGTLDLANLPVVAGTNAVRTVLRDAYGREQSFDLRAAYSPGLLAPGLSDYAYHLGFLREGFGQTSFQYGRPVALARHRLGLSEAVTAGYRLEGGLDRASGGPSLSLGTLLGTFDGELAGSVERGRPGAAAAASWLWVDRRTSAGLRVRAATPGYSNASLDFTADRAAVDASAFVAVRATARLGLGLEGTASRWRDAGETTSVTARADLGLGAGLALLASATTEWRQGSATFLGQVFLSWALGSRTTATAGTRAGTEGVGASLGAQRMLPVGSGYGYRLEAAGGEPQSRGLADLQWQTDHGRYEAQVERAGSSSGGVLSAAGGAVLIGGRGFLTRPLESSFGLMRVGVPEVRGYLENQEVGRTDAQGDLLVPALLPRYANRLAIRASDIPMDYEVGKVERLVAPPFKRGVVARFDVKRIRAVMARIEVERGAGPEVPTNGQVEVKEEGGTTVVPTTSDGRFFLEHVAPGPHEVELTWARGTCRFTMEVPDGAGIQDLGTLRCAPEATALAQ